MSRVRSNLVGQRSSWSKLINMLMKVFLDNNMYFFFVESSLDLTKNHWIVAGFEHKQRNLTKNMRS